MHKCTYFLRPHKNVTNELDKSEVLYMFFGLFDGQTSRIIVTIKIILPLTVTDIAKTQLEQICFSFKQKSKKLPAQRDKQGCL